MEGNPTQFEAIGNRLGFRIAEETDESSVWSGRVLASPRFFVSVSRSYCSSYPFPSYMPFTLTDSSVPPVHCGTSR